MQTNNYYFDKILKAVIIAGIVQLICTMLVVVLNYSQYSKLSSLVSSSNSINELNDFMSQMYKAQAIVEEYVDTNQNGKDRYTEISKIIFSCDDMSVSLKKYLSDDGNAYLITIGNNAATKYEIIRNNVSQITAKMYLGQEVTMKEYTCLIVQPIQNLQISTSMIITNISEKNEVNIIKGRDISKSTMIISGFISGIILFSVICFTFIIIKNGKELATRQFMAESKANSSILKSYTDNLTGLWNRKYIENKVNEYIGRSEKGYLFMFDMDNFKSVNDTYGHIAGDNVLKGFAEVLKSVSREYDICCRAGGDEYMLFVKGIPAGKVPGLANRIIEYTAEKMQFIEGGRNVTISIGIAPIMEHINNFQELYDLADGLLYKVKNSGKNNYIIYKTF